MPPLLPTVWTDRLRQVLTCYDEALLRRVAGKLFRPRSQWPAEELIERSLDTLQNAVACDRLRDAGRGHIFRDVAVFEPDHDDLLDAGLAQRLDLGGTDRGAFLEHQRSLAQGVNGDAADRVRRAGGTEFHAAFSLGNRNCAVISAMMATAISDGETAPIGSPIGA